MAEFHNVTQVYSTAGGISMAPNETVLTTAKAKLWGLHVNTVVTGELVIEDSNAVAMFTIPAASLAAGVVYDFAGVLMDGITINPADTNSGNVTFMWSEVGP